MDFGFLNEDLLKLGRSLYGWLKRLWLESIWPLVMGFSLFGFLAVPLLIVLAVLWYLDSIQWRPEAGHYKIGLASACSACTTSASLQPSASVRRSANSASAAAPPASSAEIA